MNLPWKIEPLYATTCISDNISPPDPPQKERHLPINASQTLNLEHPPLWLKRASNTDQNLKPQRKPPHHLSTLLVYAATKRQQPQHHNPMKAPKTQPSRLENEQINKSVSNKLQSKKHRIEPQRTGGNKQEKNTRKRNPPTARTPKQHKD